jgi:hypothetical protein
LTVAIADADFLLLASGQLNPQKAFSAGKLKVKGNVALASYVLYFAYMRLFNQLEFQKTRVRAQTGGRRCQGQTVISHEEFEGNIFDYKDVCR